MKTDNVNQPKVTAGSPSSSEPVATTTPPAKRELSPSIAASAAGSDSPPATATHSLSLKTTPNASPSATPTTLTFIDRHRIESLKRKQRSDAFLHKLTDEQIARVLTWFQEEDDVLVVHYYITAPPPQGLGLEISTTSVRRLRAHITATHANNRATEILDTIIDMEPFSETSSSSEHTQHIQSAIYQLLHQKAFELVRSKPGSVELRDLLNTIEKLAALDLKRQKVALDREKMLRHHKRPFIQHHRLDLNFAPPNNTTTGSSHPSPPSAPRQPVDLIAPSKEPCHEPQSKLVRPSRKD